MSFVTILFVHSGSSKPPECLTESAAIAYSVAPLSKIIILTQRAYVTGLKINLEKKIGSFSHRLSFAVIEELSSGQLSQSFLEGAKIDREFRDGFWFATSNRFMLIADFMQSEAIENCLHLENDNVLFFDPTEKIKAFQNFAKLAVPHDRTRAIPGIVWLRDAEIAIQLAHFINENSDKQDMDILREFCDSKKYDAKPLPTMPLSYAEDNNLNKERYCLGLESFGGIFDAAAIGQYLGGVHWLNDPNDTRFFINESSEFNLRNIKFSWDRDLKIRFPVVSYKQDRLRVLSLHAHSKDSLGVSPNNANTPDAVSSLITGERIQSFADLTISSSKVTLFHGRDKINSKEMLEIPEKEERHFFKKRVVQIPPKLDFIKTCQEAKIIFVYTHLLDYFEKYVAPRLYQSFTLLTHNSDEPVNEKHLSLLNNPYLKMWYAQNAEFSHNKLRGIPIGLANSQWGESRLEAIYKAGQGFKKTKLVYTNFTVTTHSSRENLISIIEEFDFVTKSAPVSFDVYINDLAQHQFCLCPRGNGIDTHRFWEAQYVDCIPVIQKSDWIAAYSGLPILVLNAWEDLRSINWQEEYVRISTTYYDRSPLQLDFWRKEILEHVS